jgi:hypothetical protein
MRTGSLTLSLYAPLIVPILPQSFLSKRLDFAFHLQHFLISFTAPEWLLIQTLQEHGHIITFAPSGTIAKRSNAVAPFYYFNEILIAAIALCCI